MDPGYLSSPVRDSVRKKKHPTQPWQPLHEKAYAHIRQALMTGQYRPGRRITLRELADSIGVSAMPVRDAVRRLIAEGAVEVRSTRYVQVPLMTTARLAELRDIRVELETLAVTRAIERLTGDDIKSLRAIAEQIASARQRHDTTTDMRKIREFHYSLYAASDLPYLTRLLDNVWTLTGPYLNLLFPHYTHTNKGLTLRTQLVQALEY